jgi:hypothetical protein
VAVTCFLCCVRQVFDTIEAANIDSTVKVSFLELYNEELTDLLAASGAIGRRWLDPHWTFMYI